MNVHCPECSTEFVLDEAQIPAGGLQVQCTQCGAVFNAQKPNPNLPAAKSDGEWMIRQPNGTVFRFRELTTLQRWIVERKVTREDAISRTGQKWELLGNIAELAVFFEAVDVAPQPHLVQPIAGTSASPAPAPAAAPGAARAQVQVGLLPGDPAAPAVPSGSVLEKSAAWEDTPQARPQAPQTGNWQMQSGPDDFDDDDLDFRPKRRGWLWVALVFAVVGGAAAFYSTQPQMIHRFLDGLAGKTPPELLAKVDAAYLDLMPDTVEAFEAARTRLEALREAHPSLVEADVALAEVLLARAHHARRHRAVLAALPEKQGDGEDEDEDEDEDKDALASDVDSVALSEPEVTKLLDRAGELLRESATSAVELPSAKRAMMELQRLRGNRDTAEKLLVELRALPGSQKNRWTLLLSAELENDTGALQTLAAETPALIRARMDLAWAHFETDDVEGAKTLAEAILESAPHPTAMLLLARLANPPGDEDAEAETEKQEQAEGEEGPSFARLLAMADRARDSDRSGRALVLYERALELQPDDIEALTGMGFAYLDLDKLAAATATFKRVLQLNARFSPAHIGAAEAFYLRDMKRDALKHYRRYLDLVPNGPDATVAKRMIEELSE